MTGRDFSDFPFLSHTKCSECGEDKPSSEFYRDSERKTGLNRNCKSCVKKERKKVYKREREKDIKYSRSFYDKNKEEIRVKMWMYRSDNGGYLDGSGICLYCGEINPLLLENHHVFGRKLIHHLETSGVVQFRRPVFALEPL